MGLTVKLAALKTVGTFALFGLVVGDVLATLIAPGILTWYNTPGAATGQAICDTAKMSHEIFDQLIRAQMIGSGSGAVLFIALAIVVLVRRSRAHPAAPAGGAPPPPGPAKA